MDRRIVKTKKAIRQAFSSLIKEKPIEEITVSELSEKADIDRRTFYLHYSAIIDITTEIENEAVAELNALVAQNTNCDLALFIECLNQILLNNFDYYQCITSTLSYYRFQKECAKILKTALTRTFFSQSGLPAETFDFYAEYVTAGIMAVYIKWVNSDQKCSIEELSETVLSAVRESWQQITGKKENT